MRAIVLLSLLVLLSGCGLHQSSYSLTVEQISRRQLPLVHVWEISVRVTNGSGPAMRVDPSHFTVVDSAGEEHKAGVSAAMVGVGLAPVVTLPEGQSTVVKLIFTLPADRTPVLLDHKEWGELNLPDQ